MQSLAIVVTSSPCSNLTVTAIDLVQSALSNNIKVVGVFFYQDGVLNAAKELSIASDEYQAVSQWQKFYAKYKVPLHLCVTAAEKRGLTDEIANNNQTNICDEFILSGLGELVELTTSADRVIQL